MTTHSIVRLKPTAALLQMCPFQSTPNLYGCISRREVSERRVDFASKSIVNIAPNNPAQLHTVNTNAGLWLQGVLGSSDAVRDLGYNHSMIMNKKFNLNARYRSGFMISPIFPWQDSDLASQEIRSIIELAQFSISAVMMSLDTNIGSSYVSPMPDIAPLLGRRLLQNPEAPSVSRMLLTVGSQPPSGDQAGSVVETSMREITSVNNNDNVARAVCGGTLGNCEMFTVKKTVSVEDFCLSEADFVARNEAQIAADFRESSTNRIGFLRITSVVRAGFETICRQTTRRLLQTQVVFVNMAVQTNGQFVLAVDRLRMVGYSDVAMLSSNVSLLRLCDTTTPGSCTIIPVELMPLNITVPLYGATQVVTNDVAAPAIAAIVIGCVLFVGCVGFIVFRNYQTHNKSNIFSAVPQTLQRQDYPTPVPTVNHNYYGPGYPNTGNHIITPQFIGKMPSQTQGGYDTSDSRQRPYL